MTWSYSLTDLATSPKDQVRLAIGDTVSTDPQLQDEEIAAFIAGRATIDGACADACRSLAAKYARSVNEATQAAKISFSDLSKAYARQAIAFEQKAVRGGSGQPYAGGISVADKISQEQDTDRVTPQFQIGMDDNQALPVASGGNETETYGRAASS